MSRGRLEKAMADSAVNTVFVGHAETAQRIFVTQVTHGLTSARVFGKGFGTFGGLPGFCRGRSRADNGGVLRSLHINSFAGSHGNNRGESGRSQKKSGSKEQKQNGFHRFPLFSCLRAFAKNKVPLT